MKNLILAVVLGFGFWVSHAQAKDGPFPMLEALGEWLAPETGIRIEISLSHFDEDSHPVLLVALRSSDKDPSKRRLLASGLITLSNSGGTPSLEVPVKGDGQDMTSLILTPQTKKTDDGRDQFVLSAVFVKKGEGNKNIPSALVKMN